MTLPYRPLLTDVVLAYARNHAAEKAERMSDQWYFAYGCNRARDQ